MEQVQIIERISLDEDKRIESNAPYADSQRQIPIKNLINETEMQNYISI